MKFAPFLGMKKLCQNPIYCRCAPRCTESNVGSAHVMDLDGTFSSITVRQPLLVAILIFLNLHICSLYIKSVVKAFSRCHPSILA